MVFSGYSGFLHTKTGRPDIAEILLKVALNTKIQIISIAYVKFIIHGFSRLVCVLITFIVYLRQLQTS